MTEHTDVLIVGGGSTGLTAAYRLSSRGVRVLVAEASPRVGGVVETEYAGGQLLEHGPFSVMARSDEFRQLIAELGLDATEVNADASKRRYIQRGGRLRPVPTSPGSLLTSSLLSPLGKARVLSGLLRSPPPTRADDLSVYDAAERRLGREAARRIVGPGCVGIFAAEADELDLSACMPRIASVDREVASGLALMRAARTESEGSSDRKMLSFNGGLGAMIDALQQRLQDDIHTQSPVDSLRELSPVRGFMAQVGTRTVRANSVVVTTGAHQAASIVSELSPSAATQLRHVRNADLGVVHMVFERESIRHPMDGFGYLVPKEEPCTEPVLGVIWPASVFPHQAQAGTVLVRAMVGGTRWPTALDDDDSALISRTLDSITPVMGVEGRPLLSRVVRWPASVPVYDLGHAERVASIQQAVDEVAGLCLAGSWICGPTGGLGVNDRVRHAWQTADQIVESMLPRRAQSLEPKLGERMVSA